MKKQILATVVILAGAGVAFAQMGPGRGAGPAGPGERGRGRGPGMDPMALRQELGLSDAQVDQLRKMRVESRKADIRRRADLQVARLDLHELMTASALDERAVTAKAKEVSDLQAAGFRAHVDSMLAMRKVLTPEQVEKLRTIGPRGARPAGFGLRGPRGPRPGAPGQRPTPPGEDDDSGE